MWTGEQRRIYRRESDGYPSDLRDVEWARLALLIPSAVPVGRLRKTDTRAAMNASLYLLRTGFPGAIAICRAIAFRARLSATSLASSSLMASGR